MPSVRPLVRTLSLALTLVVLTPGKASTEGGVVEEIVQLDEAGSVQLVVAPAKAGPNQIHLYTYDPSGRPADIAESITLDLTLPAAQIGPLERAAERAGPAHYQLDGDDLAVGGRWELTIHVRVDRFTEVTETIAVDVAS